MRIAIAVAALAAAATVVAVTRDPSPARDPYRPAYHYTPARNWMNDPNGLVFHDGEYHLFYQHNPGGADWGDIGWGHAVSRDLVTWEELPVALRAGPDGMAFSGSAVVDAENTSGFGPSALVAVYTTARDGTQTQSLAFSTDRGRTWTEYAGNPVLDIGLADFRDPKVFWHAPSRRWVMAVVRAAEHRVSFYGSPDLKTWAHLSDFGPAGATGGVWECPDLIELPVEGSPGETAWMLTVSLNPGGPVGGSGAQYFVGRFDGTAFVPDATPPELRWLDHGPDYYAAVSWNGLPAGPPVMIGWMSNWAYAGETPTGAWRGAMSVPREIRLRRDGDRLVALQQPVATLRSRADGEPWRLAPGPVAGERALDVAGTALDIEAELALEGAARAGIDVRVGDGERTRIAYDAVRRELVVDRSRSGARAFSPGEQRAPLEPRDGVVALRVLVDRSSVEVFADDGAVVLTDLVFPRADSDGVALFADGGEAAVRRLEVHRIR